MCLSYTPFARSKTSRFLTEKNRRPSSMICQCGSWRSWPSVRNSELYQRSRLWILTQHVSVSERYSPGIVTRTRLPVGLKSRAPSGWPQRFVDRAAATMAPSPTVDAPAAARLSSRRLPSSMVPIW